MVGVDVCLAGVRLISLCSLMPVLLLQLDFVQPNGLVAEPVIRLIIIICTNALHFKPVGFRPGM